jgi:hypothetical protein
LFFLRQEELDLPQKFGVFAAYLTEECLPGLQPTLQSRVEEPFYSPPTFLVHGISVLAISQVYCIAGGPETGRDKWDKCPSWP